MAEFHKMAVCDKNTPPELRATLDLIMNHMKQIEGEIKTLTKEGHIHEKHESTLVLAMYNVGDMIANCVEFQIWLKEIQKFKGEKHG